MSYRADTSASCLRACRGTVVPEKADTAPKPVEEGRAMSEQVTIDLGDLREIIKLLHARYDDERFVPRARYRELARKLEMIVPRPGPNPGPIDALPFNRKRIVIRLEII
jgi:hypothetical protein